MQLGEPPAWFAELPSPRILYVGALSTSYHATTPAGKLHAARIVILVGIPQSPTIRIIMSAHYLQ